MSKDYYKILEVDKESSKEEIKKSFRKLAHKYHPDKKDGDEKKFKEINEAYGVLSNDKKRAEYDSYGRVFSGAGGPEGFDFSQFSGFGQNGSAFEFDLGDIFGDIFNNRRTQARRGRDISIDLEISFEESIFGTERKILVTKTGLCSKCQGSGGEKGTKEVTCSTCNGKGRIRESKRSFFGTVNTERTCFDCSGKGQVPEKKCSKCGGVGLEKVQEEISVRIPSGIENGEMIRMSEMGEAIRGGQAGDLYIKVHVERHSIFKKSGQDLLMDLDVKLSDALLGVEYSLNTLDGKIKLKIPEGLTHGEVLRVKNYGVPHGSKRGDLLVKANIKFPKKVSNKARKIIEELKEEGI